MTDKQIQRAIDAMIPDLRIAIKALISGETVHAFDFGQGVNSATGIKTKMVCFLAHEAPAAILEGAAEGFQKAQEIAMRQINELREIQDKQS